jgi:hypothetical protein
VHARRLAVIGSYTAVVVSCGGRTGLLAPTDGEGGLPGSNDASFADDGGSPVAPDALPPIDVVPRPVPNGCPDASATLIYVITQSGTLLSFDPSASAFATIGPIHCTSASTPNSMAVDRTGVAYVGFHDGHVFRVSTRTASCQPTSFVAQTFTPSFGMGFASNSGGAGETLYIAAVGGPSRLASIDTTTFAVQVVGTFTPTILSPELTGTGAGDLFAFSSTGGDSIIAQVDKSTARIVAEVTLPGVLQGAGWAFAFWGGDFYTFTAPALPGSVVTRFRPSDGSIVPVARYADIIVGAGVSTCAPQN